MSRELNEQEKKLLTAVCNRTINLLDAMLNNEDLDEPTEALRSENKRAKIFLAQRDI